MRIKELFSIPIASEYLNLDLITLKEFCLRKKIEDKGRVISNEGGWQSNLLSLEEVELSDLYSIATKVASEFSKNIELKDELKLSNSWININGFKDCNIEHIHPLCLASAVFYIKVPENGGNIEFTHPAADTMCYDWIEPTKFQRNRFTSLNWMMESKENFLYVFPSWLKHRVKPNLNPFEERISIAFNFK